LTISNKASRKAALWLLFSSLISIAWGYWIDYSKKGAALGDLRAIYYGARTVQAHHDPYNDKEFLQVYLQQGGTLPAEPERIHPFFRSVPVCVNLPPTLFVVLPLTLLGWGPAHFIWMSLIPLGLMLAAWLMWDLAGAAAPALTLFLVCMLMANCEVILQLGNGSGLATSLCVVAVWCLFKQRYEAAGVLCLALALCIKPQQVGLIWLFLLLAGGSLRRRAWQVSAIALVLVLCSLFWVSQVSPHWLQEWHANMASTSGRGDLNDPGPTSFGNQAVGVIVSLQAVISFFWDDPQIYGPATWLLAGIPILILCVTAFRARLSHDGRWLAIGSMAALSLLPVYHRQYDCKLLLLTIPACAVLWARGGMIRKAAAVVTTAGIVFTADLPVAILVVLNKSLHLPQDQLTGKLVSILLGRSSTLSLVLVGGFYLWAFVKHEWRAKARVPGETELQLEMATLST
jgi:hypothetical protein